MFNGNLFARSKAAANPTWHSRDGYKPAVPWLRARERYRVRNAITGVVLLGFIGGVCPFHFWTVVIVDYYTIRAVDQDTFEDVPMPPPPSLPADYTGVRHRNVSDSPDGSKKRI